VSERYEFIDAEHAAVAAETAPAPTVTQMCTWLKVYGYMELRSVAHDVGLR